MNDLPKNYTKKHFINHLERNENFASDIISRIENLPEIIKYDDYQYYLNIIASWDNDNTEYNFELNYYSSNAMEFLFGYKTFNDIEKCLDYVEHHLKEKELMI